MDPPPEFPEEPLLELVFFWLLVAWKGQVVLHPSLTSPFFIADRSDIRAKTCALHEIQSEQPISVRFRSDLQHLGQILRMSQYVHLDSDGNTGPTERTYTQARRRSD